jgi:DNA-binding CsgD family transcriptional regulator
MSIRVPTDRGGPKLHGRVVECEQLDELVSAVRSGRSGALVVRGEPGCGKSALLDYVAARSGGCRLDRVLGVEAELELPYAKLHQLCMPVLDRVELLPTPQREALQTAFGLTNGRQPDPFLVGLAALSLLSDVAETQPLVCLVDDAHWLDHASALVLAFVARRLEAESILLVFAEREEAALDELAGLPELHLGGLSPTDARELLEASSLGPLDERVLDRIVAESRGNPLALLELPRGVSSASLAGGLAFALPDSLPLVSRIEASFRRRVGRLPEETQRLLLVGAAEPLGDPVLLWRAAAGLGISPEAAAPAEMAGLVEVGSRVTFRHPLLRSVIYRAASPDERRRVHGELATATEPTLDPDRRAWHRAHATLAPDEDVAAELESSADRAQARGGLAAAAAFLQRSAELTREPRRRARRALAAARAKGLAGLSEAASDLVATATQGPLTPYDSAIAERLRGQIALEISRNGDAAELLLDAARRLEGLDVRVARETYLEALWAAVGAGRFGAGVVVAAEAARAAPSAEPATPTDTLVDGLAVLYTDGFASGAPILKRALAMFRDLRDPDERELRGTLIAARIAGELLDDDTWNVLATRHVQLARQSGLYGVLPVSLGYLGAMRVHEGNLDAAAALLGESDAIVARTGNPTYLTRLLLAACRGDEAESSMLNEALEQAATARGHGLILTVCENVTSLLQNGLGHYERALEAAEQACAHDDLSLWSWSLPELVEAAVRSGDHEMAVAAHERFSERARVSGTVLARGLDARSRALVSEDGSAEAAYGEAIELLGRTRVRLSLARAKLLYGEWLRRHRRRADARAQLRAAYDMFSDFGADAFVERARRELAATGETVRRRNDETRGQLTPQERQIARLAADGHTNPEIGAQLFLSARTVEWHLGKVFTKLGIHSRRELRGALPGSARAA